MPFICRTDKKISVEDVKWVLSSHYQNTVYDPYGTLGTDEEKELFRPIGINRNQELHILQIRNDVPAEIAGIHWLAFGPNTFNAVVPFYSNVKDTPPKNYKNTTGETDPTNIYWLGNIMALMGDADFPLYEDEENIFEQNTVAGCRNLQIKADQEVANQTDKQAYLEDINNQMADLYQKNANRLLGRMLALGEPKMKLQFTLND